jgi:hypothetical protein
VAGLSLSPGKVWAVSERVSLMIAHPGDLDIRETSEKDQKKF